MTPPLAATPAARLRFAELEFDPGSGELFRAGERLPLQPQPARLLGLLLARPGQVVSREELRDLLWGDAVHVDFEQGLAFAVKQLRRALGDTAAEPRLLETLPRRGYRLLVAVEPVAEPGSRESPPAAEAATVSRRRRWISRAAVVAALSAAATAALVLLRPASPVALPRLAVLPFETFGAGAALEPLAAGLTEELITEITKRYSDRLGVIARTSVMPYRGSDKKAGEIARELDVGFLLEGSVRRQGEQLRVSAQLIRAEDEVHLWAASLDGSSLDLMAWEQRVAREVAAALSPRLPAAGPESSTAAPPAAGRLPAEDHQAYLESLYLLGQPSATSAELARARLEELVRRQPGFAPGWVALAEAHLRRQAAGREVLPQAEEAVRRALELDADLPEAHFVAGSLAFQLGFDWPRAEAELSRALELNPGLARAHHELGSLLAAQGRFDQAIEAIERARALDPRSLWVASDLGFFYYLARRYPQAIAASREALALDPSFHWAHHFVLLSALASGDEATALAAARAEWRGRRGGDGGIDSLAAYWQQELDRLASPPGASSTPAALLARPALALGQTERALELLEEAVRSRTGWYLPFLAVEPFFDPLRGEERFRRLLAELGLDRRTP